jgi:hypothetical protein
VEQLGANVLRVLVRELGRTSRVQEILTAIICQKPKEQRLWPPGRDDDAAVVAVELLADGFGGSEATLSAFAPNVPTTGAPPVLPVVAMCVGWSKAEQLDAIFQYLRQKKVDLHPFGRGAVIATKSSADRVVEMLVNYEEYIRPLRRSALRLVTRVGLRRLREDDEVFDLASAARVRTTGPQLATLLRLLVAARGVSDNRARIEELVAHELDGELAPTSVLDPFTGAPTTVGSLLLDGVLAR